MSSVINHPNPARVSDKDFANHTRSTQNEPCGPDCRSNASGTLASLRRAHDLISYIESVVTGATVQGSSNEPESVPSSLMSINQETNAVAELLCQRLGKLSELLSGE